MILTFAISIKRVAIDGQNRANSSAASIKVAIATFNLRLPFDFLCYEATCFGLPTRENSSSEKSIDCLVKVKATSVVVVVDHTAAATGDAYEQKGSKFNNKKCGETRRLPFARWQTRSLAHSKTRDLTCESRDVIVLWSSPTGVQLRTRARAQAEPTIVAINSTRKTPPICIFLRANFSPKL